MKCLLFIALSLGLNSSAYAGNMSCGGGPHVSHDTVRGDLAIELWNQADKDNSVHYEDREDGSHLKQTGSVKYKGRSRYIECSFNRVGDQLEKCDVEFVLPGC